MRWVFFRHRPLTEKEKKWLEKKIKEHYQVMLFNIIDIFSLYLKGKPFFSYKVKNSEYFNELLSRDRGFLLLLSHLGNWEFLGWWLAKVAKVDIGSFYLDQYLKAVDKFLLKLRKKSGVKLFHRIKEIKKGLSFLKNNGILAFLSDQDGLSEGEYFYFFDRLVSAPPGVVKISQKYGYPVLPVVLTHDLDTGENIIRFFPFFYPSSLKEVYAFLEEQIKLYPEEWLWLYGRWRRRRHVIKYAFEHSLPLYKKV